MSQVKEEIASALQRLTKKELLNLISSYSESDLAFYEFIKVTVGFENKKTGPSINEFIETIDEVFGNENLNQFLSFDQEQRFFRLIESIGTLNKSGRSKDAMKLVEHSFQYVENIVESVMEPDIFPSQCFDELIDIHLEACRNCDVDRDELEKLVSNLEATDDYGIFLDLRKKYSDVLKLVLKD